MQASPLSFSYWRCLLWWRKSWSQNDVLLVRNGTHRSKFRCDTIRKQVLNWLVDEGPYFEHMERMKHWSFDFYTQRKDGTPKTAPWKRYDIVSLYRWQDKTIMSTWRKRWILIWNMQYFTKRFSYNGKFFGNGTHLYNTRPRKWHFSGHAHIRIIHTS